MKTIKYSYNPDLSKIGTVEEVDNDTARELVREGRARYVEAEATVPEPGAEIATADTSAVKATKARAAKSDDPTG
jgi:topoisomerase IA-like protein